MNLGHFQAIDKGSDVLTNFEKSVNATKIYWKLMNSSGLEVFLHR